MNLGQYIAQQLLENDQYTIGVFPGAFKPPHKGHFNVVKKLADMCDEVQILISPKTREGITKDESVAIWELYKSILPGNVNYLVANENPVKETYNLITSNPEAKIVAAFGKDEFTRFNSILSNEKYRNAGVGQQLLERAIGLAQKNQISEIQLDYWEGNTEASSFFTENGFKAFNHRMMKKV